MRGVSGVSSKLVWIGIVMAIPMAGCECSPPSCRSTSGGLTCGSFHTPVCQERSCGLVAAPGTACDLEPCTVEDPRVCGAGYACDRDSHTCVARPDLLQACDPDAGPDACGWPWVCDPFQDPVRFPSCAPRPDSFPPEATGLCVVGSQAGQSCERSWDDPEPTCLRCEPGLDCVDGTCVQNCRDSLDCPCDQSCAAGHCRPAPCVVGDACERLDGECGECLATIDGPHCIPVGGHRDGDGACALDESPPACNPPTCGVGEVLVCGDSRCAEVATAWDSDAPEATCTVSPCQTSGVARVCPFPTTCISDACTGPECVGRCLSRSTAPPDQLSGCSARSENNLNGSQCTFPLVCRGFDGEPSGGAGGCPDRGSVPSGYFSLCVRGQARGQACDADYLDPVTSCLRCEPGLTCIDGRCQQPCGSTTPCPCGETCNAGVCGPGCATPGTACTATPGLCGQCVANPLGPPVCDPADAVSEACGGQVGIDDDCDGVADEPTPDRTCDGVDDDCDGTTDEDWSFLSQYLANVIVTCPDGVDDPMPGHWECHGVDGPVKLAVPGLDYCDGPGVFPDPSGGSGFLYCGGGDGDSCLSLPCHWAFTCMAGVCRPNGMPLSCTLLCDPANPSFCTPCNRRELGTECVWPGPPP